MQVIAEVSEDLGEAMTGINCDGLVTRFADREGGNMPAAKKPRMESYGDKGLAGTAFWSGHLVIDHWFSLDNPVRVPTQKGLRK